jgi:hypothetical protein
MLWSQYKLATIRRTEFLRKKNYRNSEYRKSEFQFSDSPDIGISKIISDRNLWNQKWNRNSTSNGGPRNWNQELEFPTKATREDPVVQERKSRQCMAARSNKTFKMACKYVNGKYIFHQPCGLWNAPCVQGCGYIHLLSSTPGSRKKCCTNGRLSSASDNFDKELMMNHGLEELPQFLRQAITSSPDFLQKSSTYNNLVTMAATVAGNYNDTNGFSQCGQGPQSVFMNGHVYHYMRIASSSLQNCGISYFIFDDVASLAGSVDAWNIDPVILSNICEGLRNENPYCLIYIFLA